MVHRPALWRYAQLTAAWAAFVIFAGAMVTSTGSGMAVPDWPQSFGTWTPKMTGGVFYEHGHRMVAGALGVLILALAVLAAAWERRRWARVLAYAALVGVVVQAALGGFTVLIATFRDWVHTHPGFSSVHASLAQLIFALLVAIATVSAKGWMGREAMRPVPAPLARLSVGLALLVYVQIIVGAAMRQLGGGLALTGFPLNSGRIIPDFDNVLVVLNFAHRCGAWILAIGGTAFVLKVARDVRLDAWTRLPARVFLAAVLLQFVLGAAVVLTLLAHPVLRSLHVLGGSAVFTSAVVLALRLNRAALRA